MRVEKEYSENMTRADIYTERELYDISMRLHLLAKRFEIGSETFDKFEDVSNVVGDLRIYFIKSFE